MPALLAVVGIDQDCDGFLFPGMDLPGAVPVEPVHVQFGRAREHGGSGPERRQRQRHGPVIAKVVPGV